MVPRTFMIGCWLTKLDLGGLCAHHGQQIEQLRVTCASLYSNPQSDKHTWIESVQARVLSPLHSTWAHKGASQWQFWMKCTKQGQGRWRASPARVRRDCSVSKLTSEMNWRTT